MSGLADLRVVVDREAELPGVEILGALHV